MEVSSPDSGSWGARAAVGLRILLAEDNEINRALVAGILEKRGHSLVHAANGREALEFATTEPFDLIFMDVQMPEIDGLDVTRRIREIERAKGGRHTPIVALTAHAMTGYRQQCLEAGMDDYLSKPLERASLFALVERISANRKVDVAAPEPSAPSDPVLPEPPITLASPFDERRCIQIARAASLLAFLIGLSILVAWVFDFRALTTVLPGFVSMKPNSAVAFCFAGLSLFLFTTPGVSAKRRSINLSTAFAGAVAIIGVLSIVEYATGFNLGIDELLFRDHTRSSAPGRMAPISAFSFVCFGLALVLLRFPKKTGWAQALAGSAGFASLFAMVGYVYGVVSLYQSGNFTAIPLPTAIAFLALCIGLWCSTSRYGFMRVMTGTGTSGKMLRRNGSAAVVFPFLLGWMRMQGERFGWYGSEIGVAIFAMANATTFATLVWIGARSLRIAERKEALVQKSIRL